LVTERLLLRRPSEEDVEPLARMNADPEVMRYIGDGSVLPQVLPAVEIGWRLRRQCWGHGYATEAARALLRFGFAGCGLDRVISIRHIDNLRSGRVMDKLGMRFAFETVVPAHGRPIAVHEIAKAAHDALPIRPASI
jgi:RimJ/RimL family protein N-acetyltransferase